MKTVEQVVKKIVCEIFGKEKDIDLTKSLKKLGLDSIDFFDFSLRVAEECPWMDKFVDSKEVIKEFDIETPLNEMINFIEKQK